MDRSQLINKRLALLLWETKDSAFRIEGEVIEKNGQLFLADDEYGHLPIKDDWLSKVKKVEGSGRFMLKSVDVVMGLSIDEVIDDSYSKEMIYRIIKHRDQK